MPSGIIIKGIGGFYYVLSDDGIYECKARGIFRKDELTPLVGDRVIFSVTDSSRKEGNIETIKARSSVLERPAIANADQLIAVIAIKSPQPDMLLLDKMLITAKMKAIDAVVCINKTDLDEGSTMEIIAEPYIRAGYRVIGTSSVNNTGFDELKSVLTGHISVFAGQSGVGKSTLLNRIMNTMVMETGTISRKIGRGRHTTRHAELISLEGGGFVADTPGFSLLELSGVTYDELQYHYPEFREYIDKCRFAGCSHISEPDCAVKTAVDTRQVNSERYSRYTELYAMLKQKDDIKYRKGMRKKT
ncbi:MAG: ribosome small subunit-dependent GTPase A [Acetivibrionales bacterium]